MGEIILCVDPDLDRQVVMKRMLPATAADPKLRARFIDEARITGQLEHPNIVPVHELGPESTGRTYFTMKLVKGQSLAAALQAARKAKEPPPLSEMLEIFQKVCDGVAFAHSRGVIHRDLKPANIMVGHFGEVLVMDWGLAKVVGRDDVSAEEAVRSSRSDSDILHTLAGSVLGTARYMSPEQAAGDTQALDHRSDIYSLGVILYEMLTLRHPVEGATSREVVAKVRTGAIVPIEDQDLSRPVARELAAVVTKCLATSPEDRYQSAGDLRKDIDLFLAGRSVSAAPDTFAQAIAKLIKRNKPISAAVATAAVVIAALTVTFFIQVRDERDRAVASEVRATAARETAELAEGKARQEQRKATDLVDELTQEQRRMIRENYALNIAAVDGMIKDRIYGEVASRLAGAPQELRHWEWGRMMYRAQPESLLLPTGDKPASQVAATRDMRRLVTFGGDWAEIWDLAEVRLVRRIVGLSAVCLLPDGRGILVARDTEVVLEEVDTGNVLSRWPSRSAKVTSLAVTGDGKVALAGRHDGGCELLSMQDGSILWSMPKGEGPVDYVAIASDHARALIRDKQSAAVWDTRGGRKLLTVKGYFVGTRSVALSSDGRRVLTGHEEMKALLWDVDTGQTLRVLGNQRGIVRVVEFSADGRHAYTGGSFGLLEWDLRADYPLRQLCPWDDVLCGLAVAPNPRWLLTAHGEGNIRIWDLQGDPTGTTSFRPSLKPGAFHNCQLALADDGQTAVVTGWERVGATVLDLENNRIRWQLESDGVIYRTGITPDGRWAVGIGMSKMGAVWDLRSGKVVATFPNVGGSHSLCLAVHPEGNCFVNVVEVEGKGGLQIKSLPDCKPMGDAIPGGALDAVFSPDGSVLLMRRSGEAVAWDLAGRKVRATLKTPMSYIWSRSVFLSDSRRALLGTPKGALMWDTVTGEVLDRYLDVDVTAVVVTGDDKRAFFGSTDQSVRVWDLEAKREMMSFSPHSGGILSLAISKDARTLLVGGWGGARDVTVHRALDWRKSVDQLQREKLVKWRTMSRAPRNSTSRPADDG